MRERQQDHYLYNTEALQPYPYPPLRSAPKMLLYPIAHKGPGGRASGTATLPVLRLSRQSHALFGGIRQPAAGRPHFHRKARKAGIFPRMLRRG